jgi:RNA recognition motif-containing protein
MVKIYIGNLSWGTTDEGLKKAFERFGEVKDANVARFRDTGRSRGFGFVEMEEEPARTAIKEMNGSELDGRVLKVSEKIIRVDRANRKSLGNHGGCGFHGGNGGRRFVKRWPRGDRGNRDGNGDKWFDMW